MFVRRHNDSLSYWETVPYHSTPPSCYQINECFCFRKNIRQREIGEVLAGTKSGRITVMKIALHKSASIAIQDVATANRVA
jgi:hypothetical protein